MYSVLLNVLPNRTIGGGEVTAINYGQGLSLSDAMANAMIALKDFERTDAYFTPVSVTVTKED